MTNSTLIRITEDLDTLSQQGLRVAGTEAERRMLHEVEERLSPDLRGRARLEKFVAHSSPELVLGLHAAFLVVVGLLGYWFPTPSAALCALSTASLTAELTGLMSPVRWLLLKVPSYNLTVRLSGEEAALGTVVISAPLDTPRWRPRHTILSRPLRAVYAAAAFLTLTCLFRALAEPWGRLTLGLYGGSLLVLVLTVSLSWFARRRVETGSCEASGPAVLLEVLRRLSAAPISDVDVWGVFTGCGYAYHGGMRMFLEKHGPRMKGPVLVVVLDRPGIAPLRAAVSEGALWPMHYRSTGPALIERMRWAGVEISDLDKAGTTDAQPAHLLGYRALALCGGSSAAKGKGATPEAADKAVEITSTAARWFAEDLRRVAQEEADRSTHEPVS